jgi:hypothetical protein
MYFLSLRQATIEFMTDYIWKDRLVPTALYVSPTLPSGLRLSQGLIRTGAATWDTNRSVLEEWRLLGCTPYGSCKNRRFGGT